MGIEAKGHALVVESRDWICLLNEAFFPVS